MFKTKANRWDNFVFGLSCIVDGLVRVLSLGFLSTDFCVMVSRRNVEKDLQRKKKVFD